VGMALKKGANPQEKVEMIGILYGRIKPKRDVVHGSKIST